MTEVTKPSSVRLRRRCQSSIYVIEGKLLIATSSPKSLPYSPLHPFGQVLEWLSATPALLPYRAPLLFALRAHAA